MHYRIVTLTTPEPKEWTMSSQGLSVDELKNLQKSIEQNIEKITELIRAYDSFGMDTALLFIRREAQYNILRSCKSQLEKTLASKGSKEAQ